MRSPLRPLLAAALVGSAVMVTFSSPSPATAATLPEGFVEDQVVDDLNQPVAMAWLPDGRFLVTEKAGVLKIVDPATASADVVLDLSAEVNNYNDRGLIGLAVDPDFPTEPWVYLAYTYDPPETASAALYWDGNGSHRRQLSFGGPDGQGHRPSRLDRVQLDVATNFTTVVGASREIVLGTNSVWANIGDPFTWQTDVDAPWTCASYGPGDGPEKGTPIPDCLPSDGGSHSVGALRFASDGSLFMSIGDGASYNRVDPRALRALHPDWLAGKILRIDPDTSLGLPVNPFYEGDGSSSRSKVHFSGLRNPFRFALLSNDQPVTGDVGWGQFEEINTGVGGSSFGWPCYEGGLTDAEMAAGTHHGPGMNRVQASYDDLAACQPYYAGSETPPIWTWCHHAVRASCSDSGHSAMAGVEYTGTSYPEEYRGVWFGDVHELWMSVLHLDGSTSTVTPVSSDVTYALDMSIGPDGNVYYVSYFGSVHRIRYVGGGNVQPQAVASADVTGGPIPLTVQFTGSSSFDPDLDAITHQWDFGDGITSTDPDPSHTYTVAGDITATLTVTDPSGASDTATLTLTPGNTAPVPTIAKPLDGVVVAIDTIVGLSGSASDAEDGSLTGTSLQWSGTLHHNDHTHEDEFLRSGENPEGYRFADHDDDTYLEVCLTATDAQGLVGTSCVDVFITEIDLTFASAPTGRDLTYNGQQHSTPFTVRVPAGVERNIDAPSPQGDFVFDLWDIGGDRSQVVTTPTVDSTWSATFEQAAPTTPQILYVAGTDGPPSPDLPIVERWEARGYQVTVVDDDDLPTPAAAEGFDLVWLSSSVVPTTVADTYAAIAAPLGMHEAFIYDDNGLATASGQKGNQTRVRNPDTGTSTRVTTAARTFSWATVGAAADVTATQNGNTSRAMVFSYETGDALADGTPAPSCRGGFFAGYDSPAVINAAGWTYFDDLTDLLLGCDAPVGGNRAPTIQPVPDRTDTEGDAVDIAITSADPDGDDLSHTASDLPSGIAIDEQTGRLTGTLAVGSAAASPYVVTITVTDPDLATATTTFEWVVDEEGGGGPTNEILLIANEVPANANDQPLIEHWESRGFEVTVAADEALPSTAVAETFDLVWISSTVKTSLVGDSYADITTPLGSHEAYLFDDNKLASSSGQKSLQTTVRDEATGEVVTVTSRARTFSWAVVGADADVRARQSNNAGRASVFSYATGDELVDGSPAPSCRGGFFAGFNTPEFIDAAGWAYLDELTDLLVGCGVPPVNRPPTIEPIADQTDAEGVPAYLAITTDDPDGDALVHSATGLPPGIAINEATGLMTGSPDIGSVAGSPYPVVVSVTDPDAAVATASFSWTIDEDGGPPSGSPNVVLIVTDDQTVADMQFMPKTASLIGGQGVTFDNSFVALSLCCPARAAIKTGQHAHNNGIWSNEPPTGGFPRFDDSTALPVWLQNAGYRTVHIGKAMQGTNKSIPAGWDDWRAMIQGDAKMYNWRLWDNGTEIQYGYGTENYQTDVLADLAARAISDEAGSPFFLHLATSAPHVQGGGAPPLPPDRYKNTLTDPLPQPPSFNVPQNFSSAEILDLQKLFRRRGESLMAVDDMVETVIDALDTAGVLDNTIVMFTSDNGYLLGEHGLTGKVVYFEESIRVPLLVRGPGFPAGTVVQSPVQNIDYAPTIAQIAGATPLVSIDGVPLQNQLTGGVDRALLLMSRRDTFTDSNWWQGIHTGRFVYADLLDNGSRDRLYDLALDPYQLDNLDKDPAYDAVEAALRSMLDTVRSCSGGSCYFTADDDAIAALIDEP